MSRYKIEMLWDCSNCGSNAIDGTKDHCLNCGAAHDTKKDPWYMPGDTSHRNRIVDRRKLNMAAADPNWTCKYCGGTQRAPDGACLNCAGPRSETHAQQASGRPGLTSSRLVSALPIPIRRSSPVLQEESDWPLRQDYSGAKIILGALAAIVLITGLLWLLFHKRPVDLEVVSVEWTQTIKVERYQQVAQSGFDEDMPSDVQNVVNEGSRVHHYDQVLDHYKTVHYTEQMNDGQDCVDIPQTCYTTPVSCSANDNGTADCSGGDEVCSGGGQSCTTRYRDEDRTREEPVYRDEPRYEDHYQWIVWRWIPQRTPIHSGTTMQTTWPDENEVCLNCQVGSGEKEREAGRSGAYEVHFVDQERTETFVHEPKSEAEFHKFPVGSKHPALYSIAGGLEFQLATN